MGAFLKDYALPLLMLIGFLTIAILMMLNPQVSLNPQDNHPEERVVLKLQDKTLLSYNIETALTPEEHNKGLMGRDTLPPNFGMLFLFSGDEERRFWMRNTRIPLDIVFIKNDGSIHHIHHMAKPYDETFISSNGPVRAVLEVQGGEMKKYGVQIGDAVIHPVFGNMELIPAQ